MARAWIIATNTLLEIRQRRVIYLVVALCALTALLVYRTLGSIEQAHRAGEAELATHLPASLIAGTIGFWNGGIWMLTCFLGATVLSAETRSRAIIPTLARPVTRLEFLGGKTLGVVVTALILFAIPLGLSVFTAFWLNVALSWTFVLGIAQLVTSYVTVAMMTVALAAVWSPMAAGLTVVAVMPVVQTYGLWLAGKEDPGTALMGVVLSCLVPAAPPVDLMGQAFHATVLASTHTTVALVMLENLAYAVVLFALCARAFTRREIRTDG